MERFKPREQINPINNSLMDFNCFMIQEINKTISEYGFFDYPISPSTDITERDYCMIISDVFNKHNIAYRMEFPLGTKRIDFYINQDNRPHYIEIKDCGLFETKYAKSLAYCKEIESGNYNTNYPPKLTFIENARARSKTDWLNYFKKNERNGGRTLGGSEGLARDIYKFYKLFNEKFLKIGNLCSCIAFVFWPQPFPEKSSQKQLSQIKKGGETIEVGTKILIEQLKAQTHMENITYDIDTIELPQVSILNPYTGKLQSFNASEIKLSIEILSWMN